MARFGHTITHPLRSPDAFIHAQFTLSNLGPCQDVLLVGDAGGRDYLMLKDAGKRLTVVDIVDHEYIPGLIVQSIEDTLPVQNESFDAVVCNEVLEHLERDQDALREIHRVLKRDGLLSLTIPFISSFSRADEAEYHVRVHTEKTLSRLLHACGFEVDRIIYRGVGCRLVQKFKFLRAGLYLSFEVLKKLGVPEEKAVQWVNRGFFKAETFIGSRRFLRPMQSLFTAYGGLVLAKKVQPTRDNHNIQKTSFSNREAVGAL